MGSRVKAGVCPVTETLVATSGSLIPFRCSSYRSNKTLRAILLAVFLLLLPCSAIAQRPTEKYNGQDVAQSEVIVKLSNPTPRLVLALQLRLDASGVRQVGGSDGPY